MRTGSSRNCRWASIPRGLHAQLPCLHWCRFSRQKTSVSRSSRTPASTGSQGREKLEPPRSTQAKKTEKEISHVHQDNTVHFTAFTEHEKCRQRSGIVESTCLNQNGPM